MIEILAQTTGPDIAGIAVQGGIGALALVMLRWFMTKNDQLQRQMIESHDRLRTENAASNERLSREVTASNERLGREIAASNDRMGRAHLMLVLALDGVNEAAKARAKSLMTEIDEALRRDKPPSP